MKFKDVVLVILIVFVICMGGYLVYDKVFSDSDLECNNSCREENNVDDNLDNSLNESKEDNNNNTNEVLDNSNTNDSSSNLSDKDGYKNADGTYGIVERILIQTPEYLEDYVEETWKFHVVLSLDGKVYIYDGTGRKVIDTISKLNNVVDIFEYYENVGDSINNFYFLTDDGYVYKSKGSDFVEKKYIASKIEGISNVKRIINVNNCYQQGCVTYRVAVTNDGNYIKLSSASI